MSDPNNPYSALEDQSSTGGSPSPSADLQVHRVSQGDELSTIALLSSDSTTPGNNPVPHQGTGDPTGITSGSQDQGQTNMVSNDSTAEHQPQADTSSQSGAAANQSTATTNQSWYQRLSPTLQAQYAWMQSVNLLTDSTIVPTKILVSDPIGG